MSEFRADPLFGNWSIIARERAARPHRVRVKDELNISGPCPLCPGHEAMCPPEIVRVPAGGRWITRAFPNQYPALRLEADPSFNRLESPDQPFQTRPGFGAHEIVVDGPSHDVPFWMFDPQQAVRLFLLLQRRIRDLYEDRRILYVQLYKNQGPAAGGSLEHPHFQLVGLPLLPRGIETLLNKKSCAVCDLLAHEQREDLQPDGTSERFLAETSKFLALADFAPAYSFQFSIYPKAHEPSFQLASEAGLEELAHLITLTIGRLARLLGDFAFNMVFYNQPNQKAFARSEPEQSPDPWNKTAHWFIRVFPRLARHAGFELATGIPIISVAPEDASRAFREKGI